MADVVTLESWEEKTAGLLGRIAAFKRARDDTLAAAGDEALLEVHALLSREMAEGRISLHHSETLEALFREIAKRGLNVVSLENFAETPIDRTDKTDETPWPTSPGRHHVRRHRVHLGPDAGPGKQ